MDAHSLECLDFPRIRELLAGYALCSLGRGLALSIRPAPQAELIRRWLAQVAEMQSVLDDHGLPPFGGITDIREVVPRCAPPLRVSAEEVARVGTTLRGTHEVAAYLRGLPERCTELRHFSDRIGDFASIAERIFAVVDERGLVRDDASPKLLGIRREIQEASSAIRDTVDHLLRDPGVRRWLQYPNHTFHNDRMVLPVRTEYRGRVPGIVHRHSDSGATIYVEPAAAVELNNQISNLRIEEEEEVHRLLWELAHLVHLNEKEILRTVEALAVLDLISAKVRMAKDFGLRCPALVEEPKLNVRGARHPLLIERERKRAAAGDATCEIIPIDYRVGDDFNLLIITGPNTGGKTVALKTVGLLTMMVQAGIPAPVADGSSFGIFKDVHIDIGDEQSMQQSLSTFSAHLTRQLDILRRAGGRALVLIDELGAGTDPDEGAAIGRTVLDELLRCGARCLVTTHLGALKGYALMREKTENACVEFDVATLRPTYRLKLGEPGSSNAIDIARALGMPARMITAAKGNLSKNARALRAALASTSAVKRQAESAREAAETARVAADRAASDADNARQQLERQQVDFQTWVQRVVHLRPGDAVRVRNFDRDGKVVRMRLDVHRAEIDVGAFAVEVPLGDVLPPETPAPPPPPPREERAEPIQPHRRPRDRDQIRPRDQSRERAGAAGPRTDGQPARAGGGRPGQQQGPRGPGGAVHAGGPPRSDGSPRPHPRRDRPERPPLNLPTLTDEEAAALEPGDRVYAKRFHREAEVVRVKESKKIVVVTVGLLEAEVPFSGLAHLTPPKGSEPGMGIKEQGTGNREQGTPRSDEGARDATAKPQAQAPVETAAGPPAPPSPEAARAAPTCGSAQAAPVESAQAPPTCEPASPAFASESPSAAPALESEPAPPAMDASSEGEGTIVLQAPSPATDDTSEGIEAVEAVEPSTVVETAESTQSTST
jgi:DNA mismatch repair protein MutS2